MLETIRRFANADLGLLLSWHADEPVARVHVAPASPTSLGQSLSLSPELCDRLAALRDPVSPADATLALPDSLRALWSPLAITSVFAVVSNGTSAGSSLALRSDSTDTAGTSADSTVATRIAATTTAAAPTAADMMHAATTTTVLIVGWRDAACVDGAALSMLARLLDAMLATSTAASISTAVLSTGERTDVELRLEALMHPPTQGVVFVDGATGTAEVNEIAARLLNVNVGTVSTLQLAVAVGALQERLRDRHRTLDEYTRLVLSDDVAKSDWVWEFDDVERSAWRVASVPVGESVRRARLWTFEDVTADRQGQRQLARQYEREQLLRRQKLEAVMRLAGGVEHDFTNLLTVISGSVEMIRDLPMARDAESDLAAIRQATQRANGLIRQLRAFSGQAVSPPEILLVDAVLQAMAATLEAALDVPWELAIQSDASGALIVMNERQFALTLLHLLERMRDVMPDGGRIVLRSARVVLPTGAASESSGNACVVISLGGDRNTADRLLLDARNDGPEQVERGTDEVGLEHATIAAIVDQAGGHIRTAVTDTGRRIFALFLPESDSRPILKVERTPARGTLITVQKHELPLLVVDDDAGPRRVASYVVCSSERDTISSRPNPQPMRCGSPARVVVRSLPSSLIISCQA